MRTLSSPTPTRRPSGTRTRSGLASSAAFRFPGNRMMTVELAFGESVVHVGSEFPEMGIISPMTIGDTATVLQITTADANALWSRAIAAGAVARHQLADAFWGERHGQLTDPFGHRWNIAQRLRDVPHDEIVAAAAQAFGG